MYLFLSSDENRLEDLFVALRCGKVYRFSNIPMLEIVKAAETKDKTRIRALRQGIKLELLLVNTIHPVLHSMRVDAI